MSPSHASFFAWTGAERPLSVDWCIASLPLAWSPKNGEVFQIGHDVFLFVKKKLSAPFLTPAKTKILVLLFATVERFGGEYVINRATLFD